MKTFYFMLAVCPLVIFDVYAQSIADIPATARANIEYGCAVRHPSLVSDYVARRQCINLAEAAAVEQLRQQRLERLAAERDNRSRSCIAAALPNIEDRLDRIRNSFSTYDRLEDAIRKLNAHFSGPGNTIIPEGNINQRVFVNFIAAGCGTDFTIFINLFADRDQNLTHFLVAGQNTPRGIDREYWNGFARDVVRERELDRRFAAEQEARRRPAR